MKTSLYTKLAQNSVSNMVDQDTNNMNVSFQTVRHENQYMQKGSARQASQPTMPNTSRNAKQYFTSQPNNIEIASSGTTQRKQSVFYDSAVPSRQKLPIISTRKAHLTVDQRVWDADHGASANQTLPFDYEQIAKLK